MLYAVSFRELPNEHFTFNSTIGRQTIWIGISLILFVICQIIDMRFWRTFAYPIYVLSIILLILVLIFGEEIKGSKSWFSLFGFSFQPSEFAKFGTLLCLSGYLGYFKTRLRGIKSQLVALGLITLPAAIILLQPDAGSALVFSSFIILFYREGVPGTYYMAAFYLVLALICGLIFPTKWIALAILTIAMYFVLFGLRKISWQWFIPLIVTGINIYSFYSDIGNVIYAINIVGLLFVLFIAFIRAQRQVIVLIPSIVMLGIAVAIAANFAFNNILEPHQQDRINVWLQPSKCDPQGSLYNVLQSKVAIGSGGMTGKGFLNGSMTRLNFVPEQSTDFIFSTIGEEQGFLGSTAVILLFIGLILRIVLFRRKSRTHIS